MSESTPNNHQPEISAEQANGADVPDVYAELAPDRIAGEPLESQKWEDFALGRTLPKPKGPLSLPEQLRSKWDMERAFGAMNPNVNDPNRNQVNPDQEAGGDEQPLSLSGPFAAGQLASRAIVKVARKAKASRA